jgi:sulfonate transport system substrate-binding protein
MITRRPFAAALCAVCVALPLACGPSSVKAQNPEPITIGTLLKTLGNAPYYVARHFKWFDSDPTLQGAPIIYKEFNNQQLSAAFASGDLQVLFSTDASSIARRTQGDDIRIAALAATVRQNILVRSDLPYKSVTDLRGKTLAVQQGTSSYCGLQKILRAYNMSESDLAVRYMAAGDAKGAFEMNHVDAWVVWPPFVEQQELTGKGRLVLGGAAVINNVVSLSKRFIDEREPVARGVVAVVRRAKAWIQGNPDEAQRIVAEALALSVPVVKQAWPKHDWAAELGDAAIVDIQDKATFLAAQDKTGATKTLDVRSDLVDTRFVGKRK